jgi:hypothetical protein
MGNVAPIILVTYLSTEIGAERSLENNSYSKRR